MNKNLETKTSELICIYKSEQTKSHRCPNCAGITNTCGFYKNPSGRNPFENCFKRKQLYEEEELK